MRSDNNHCVFFFFSSRRRHTRWTGDWSSDVCSSDLHLDGEARVDLTDGSCRLGSATVQILTRWLDVRAAIVAELEGSDPGYLWIPTKPGRPRRGRPHPARRPPNPRQPGTREPASAWRFPRRQPVTLPARPGLLKTHSRCAP